MKKRIFALLLLNVITATLLTGCQAKGEQSALPTNGVGDPQTTEETDLAKSEVPAIPTIPETTIKIVQEPYYVCSAASIGIEKGWYKELGISFDPEPYGTVITGEDTTQYVASQKADMIDQPTIQIMGAIKDLPPVKTFAFNSIFYGSVVLGQPGTKTAADFKSEGNSTQEAIKLAVGQIKGKKLCL